MWWSTEDPKLCLNLHLINFLETVYQPEKIPERDMMEPPKFTQPLTDRATTRGYNTHLFCSVRGFPQVSGSFMGSITSTCGQPPAGLLQGGWKCWEMVGHFGLGLNGAGGQQLPSRSN